MRNERLGIVHPEDIIHCMWKTNQSQFTTKISSSKKFRNKNTFTMHMQKDGAIHLQKSLGIKFCMENIEKVSSANIGKIW